MFFKKNKFEDVNLLQKSHSNKKNDEVMKDFVSINKYQ